MRKFIQIHAPNVPGYYRPHAARAHIILHYNFHMRVVRGGLKKKKILRKPREKKKKNIERVICKIYIKFLKYI